MEDEAPALFEAYGHVKLGPLLPHLTQKHTNALRYTNLPTQFVYDGRWTWSTSARCLKGPYGNMETAHVKY